MAQTVLITGGAGFIGRHVASALIARGDRVRILDSLIEQVHGEDPAVPLADDFIRGDVRDASAMARALKGVDKVVHLAAEVGVGQSMYAIDKYVAVNDLGTAVLFQALIEQPVQRVVVASSMSVYGEGLYRHADGALLEEVQRVKGSAGAWDPTDARGRPLIPVPTPETKRPNVGSVYALTKYVQERLTLNVTAAYGMEGAALRLFNVYGPGQALSNPYTGVLAIFASRILNGQAPLVFEDGEQRRDFVNVDDVSRAFLTILDRPEANGEVFNVASGRDRSIKDVAVSLARVMGREDLQPEIAEKARSGDIRHCIADVSKIERALGFQAERDFENSLGELVEWVSQQTPVDRVGDARLELEKRGLMR